MAAREPDTIQRRSEVSLPRPQTFCDSCGPLKEFQHKPALFALRSLGIKPKQITQSGPGLAIGHYFLLPSTGISKEKPAAAFQRRIIFVAHQQDAVKRSGAYRPSQLQSRFDLLDLLPADTDFAIVGFDPVRLQPVSADDRCTV